MAVIVSSSIQKQGSVTSGDIQKIVVVQTNPGYAPSPGHVGTGQIVAILCGPTNQSSSLLDRLVNSHELLASVPEFHWLSNGGVQTWNSSSFRGEGP